MPRGRGIYDDERAVKPNEPTEHGSDDSATAADDTPDVAETNQEPTA
jgi:hypothetical protein